MLTDKMVLTVRMVLMVQLVHKDLWGRKAIKVIKGMLELPNTELPGMAAQLGISVG